MGISGDTVGITLSPLTSKPSLDKALEVSGDTGDTNLPTSQNSETLMMSCTTESANPAATSTKKARTFEIGDRVVVKDVGGIYQGARGGIADILYSRTGATYLVKFDKPVKNSRQSEFDASDLMKL